MEVGVRRCKSKPAEKRREVGILVTDHPRVERPEDRRVGQLPPPPRGPRRRPPRPAHEVPRRRWGSDGRLPPPQPDGHVPGAGHQHDGLEEHQSGMLPRGTPSMRGGANMGGFSSSHLGIFDIRTNMALGIGVSCAPLMNPTLWRK